ncbi:hypothetical protein ACFQBY_19325 [Promicromonospora citrea]|uniref:Uncharacterized protein n=1 Tax=Promicromonospora citrea TaxID=43677 RepID=A0A8H9L737_9MICO|nr:hypothetical protein [Promicromonospora citrea]NNH52704.1 hypothetical protein [Promicromonospora citrea]GGM39002.1 hypothetical protein GCM10010102_38270 [Promicromonospora citrea]
MLNLRNHRPLFTAVGAVLVASTGTGIAWSQGGGHRAPADQLLDAVEHSESTMRGYLDEVGARFDEIESASEPAEQQQLAADLMADVPEIAEDVRDEVLAARQEATAVDLPDGGDLDRARDAYVAHMDAWITEYEEAIVTPAGVVEIEPEVNETFDEAVAAFERTELERGQARRMENLLAD